MNDLWQDEQDQRERRREREQEMFANNPEALAPTRYRAPEWLLAEYEENERQQMAEREKEQKRAAERYESGLCFFSFCDSERKANSIFCCRHD